MWSKSILFLLRDKERLSWVLSVPSLTRFRVGIEYWDQLMERDRPLDLDLRHVQLLQKPLRQG